MVNSFHSYLFGYVYQIRIISNECGIAADCFCDRCDDYGLNNQIICYNENGTIFQQHHGNHKWYLSFAGQMERLNLFFFNDGMFNCPLMTQSDVYF